MSETTDLARIEPIPQRFGKEKGTGAYHTVRELHHG